jgi:hypothetical protein
VQRKCRVSSAKKVLLAKVYFVTPERMGCVCKGDSYYWSQCSVAFLDSKVVICFGLLFCL